MSRTITTVFKDCWITYMTKVCDARGRSAALHNLKLNTWVTHLRRNGIHKGQKVDVVLNMPAASDVNSLKSFLGSVQFYAKFLPPSYATEAEPLYRLTKKDVEWNWGSHEQSSFERLKSLLSSDAVLTHNNLALPTGIACDASSLGIGGTLFHRYPDGSERTIANVSKVLFKSQRNCRRSRKRLWQLCLLSRSFSSICLVKSLSWLLTTSLYLPSMAIRSLQVWWQTVWPVGHCT